MFKLFISALLLVGFTANADHHFSKSDIKNILFTDNNTIIFELNNGDFFEGVVLTKRTCPIKRNYHKIYFTDDLVGNSFVIMDASGLKTCKWGALEKS